MVGAVQIGADIWKAAIINIGKLFAPVSSKKGKNKKVKRPLCYVGSSKLSSGTPT